MFVKALFLCFLKKIAKLTMFELYKGSRMQNHTILPYISRLKHNLVNKKVEQEFEGLPCLKIILKRVRVTTIVY